MAEEVITPALSPVEGFKRESKWLRGTLAEEMASDSDHLSEPAKNLLKFHGSYQQEDRDARKSRSKEGVGKHYMFMIRLKLPGGKLTANQYLVIDELADKYANSTLRVTTRQSIQFHGIIKGNLKATIKGFNDALVSSLGGCGDVNRNVMACPAPTADPIRRQMQQLADDLAEHLAPKSRAYHDIWLNGEAYSPDAEQEDGVEPIYGKVYLPRKFKIGLTRPDDNCVDIYAQDLGFVAIIENGQCIGYNVTVGGGMGRTQGKPTTFAHLGKHICFVPPEEVVFAAEKVITLYRDHGNRTDRKRARIKYLVADWGVDKFREVLEKDYFRKPLVLPKDVTITDVDLHLGWQPQGDGKWFLGLSVENGRIKNDGSMRLKDGVRAIVQKFGCDVRLSGQQDILLCNIATENRSAIDSLLNEFGIPRPDKISLVQKWSMACPAIPTCGLAISESERALPGIVDSLEKELAALGLEEERISTRMTGCPNGCARPYQSEIGIVGRSGEKYSLYLGGSTLGTRLSFLFQDLIQRDQIAPTVGKVLQYYKANRQPQESFGDFCSREGAEKLAQTIGVSLPKTATHES